MFDYHLHTTVSFDCRGEQTPISVLKAAEERGLKEICFTDHYDFNSEKDKHHDLFTLEEYSNAYDSLKSDKVKIRYGVELGLTTWSMKEADEFLAKRKFDFVLGSVHYVDGYDPYQVEYWDGISVKEGFLKYEKCILECVKVNDNFDVLGHLTYVCKSPNNPTKEPVLYKDVCDITDEIMKVLISKGKGMEVNTSGVDRAGVFLPSIEFLKRFKELGGEIVTVGSDSHGAERVGQYTKEALEIIKEVFGYVCTFSERKPIFHKL